MKKSIVMIISFVGLGLAFDTYGLEGIGENSESESVRKDVEDKRFEKKMYDVQEKILEEQRKAAHDTVSNLPDNDQGHIVLPQDHEFVKHGIVQGGLVIGDEGGTAHDKVRRNIDTFFDDKLEKNRLDREKTTQDLQNSLQKLQDLQDRPVKKLQEQVKQLEESRKKAVEMMKNLTEAQFDEIENAPMSLGFMIDLSQRAAQGQPEAIIALAIKKDDISFEKRESLIPSIRDSYNEMIKEAEDRSGVDKKVIEDMRDERERKQEEAENKKAAESRMEQMREIFKELNSITPEKFKELKEGSLVSEDNFAESQVQQIIKNGIPGTSLENGVTIYQDLDNAKRFILNRLQELGVDTSSLLPTPDLFSPEGKSPKSRKVIL